MTWPKYEYGVDAGASAGKREGKDVEQESLPKLFRDNITEQSEILAIH
jgi:hypothetical protein